MANISSNITGLLTNAMGQKMFEAHKKMRVILQITNIKVNMPPNVRACEVGAEFQIKPCDAKQALEEQFHSKQERDLDMLYVGKIQEYHEILPPDLKSQIKNKQEFLAHRMCA